MLKENMKLGAENYVNECATSSNLYKVYVIHEDTKINDIYNKYNISVDMICNSIELSPCDSEYLVNKNTVILIPYTCNKVEDKTILSALELLYNGFLNSGISDNGVKKVIRSTDNKDVSECLKVEISFDKSNYEYSYVINDKECE